MRNRLSLLTCLFLTSLTSLDAQLREYAVHSRGTLHQTVYNTGELGREYDQGSGGLASGLPSLEWPGNSALIIDGILYKGQHNSFGGGFYLAVNAPDTNARIYAYCGSAGASSPEAVMGKYSFPLSVSRQENYPILSTGGLNPGYNADEAEEIITSRWSTPTGLTVTRISRAWSYPDYDDFIIYEYEIENTGNRDGNPATIESRSALTDVLIAFAYGFTPSMIGYERTFNRWSYADYEKRDLRARFDRRRWLNYTIDRNGKPDPVYYTPWGSGNINGGGLLSPQAVGYAILYYDTTRLAHPDQTGMQITTSDAALVWDANNHLKQPYLNRLETSNLRISKIERYLDVSQTRKNNPYRNLNVYGPDWVGRGSFNVRQSMKFGVGRIMVFGPYVIPFGQKVRFVVAEVAGYGAARLSETLAGLRDEGGSSGELTGEPSDSAFYAVPNWERPITYGIFTPATYGSDYLSKYKLPPHVNSNVVTVREVTDRAIQAYTGQQLADYDSLQFWPERSPSRGVYQLPIPVPAPAITIENTSLAYNRITWGPQVESFSQPRQAGAFAYYELHKSTSALGPWSRLDSIAAHDPRYFSNGAYEVVDKNTRVGESFYYCVVSVDNKGNRSGRTNLQLHQTQLGGTAVLEKVYAVPNPFFVRSGFIGTTPSGADASTKIGFYNLPKRCTIRIYSYSGQLVETIDHDNSLYSTEYFHVTRNNQVIASGLYFYVVEAPDGKTTHGKFVVIH